MKKILNSQLIKFGLVGFLNTAVDFGVFTLLTAAVGWGSTISHIISYSCGVLNSYFVNRTWTFQQKSKSHPFEFFKFLMVNLASLGLSTLVLNYLETGVNLSIYLAKAGATLCSMAVNFVGSKLIVFKN
ncbi:MAG: GtrA family protein [Clostridia bacterium]|jgi:putative flippase GtrA|nr:GtrA family protein [Clostridia bacterium]MDD4680692.1 GtrA family protein [Clostridia bacterium]